MSKNPFRVQNLTGNPLYTIRNKAREIFSAPMRWGRNLQYGAGVLTLEFMKNAEPENRARIQSLAGKLIGNPFQEQSYMDALVMENVEGFDTNMGAVRSYFKDNANLLTHGGIEYAIAMIGHSPNSNDIFTIPKAIDAFMAKTDGLEDNFHLLCDILLCQTKLPNGDEHRWIFRDFITKYNDGFTGEMLSVALSECRSKKEPKLFADLVALNKDKLPLGAQQYSQAAVKPSQAQFNL
jgi:hypothetical protein